MDLLSWGREGGREEGREREDGGMGKRVWIEGGREGRRGRERWSGVGGCGGRKEGRKKGRKVNVYEAWRLKEEGERSSSWREGRAGQG